MLLYGGPELQDRLLLLMEDVWRRGKAVKDWQDAEVVPIPKKGDLRKCDNWRGISLLDVVGKVFAQILQDRLQMVAETVLPESQCGFRKGRGCVDMVFATRQLIENMLIRLVCGPQESIRLCAQASVVVCVGEVWCAPHHSFSDQVSP